MAADPTRRARTLRLAAEYVERKANGERVSWAPQATVTRLDAEGKPLGKPLTVGPLIFSLAKVCCSPADVHLGGPQPPGWDAVDRAMGQAAE